MMYVNSKTSLLFHRTAMTRFLLSLFCVLFALPLHAATLNIGVARCDITPPKSVPLWGSFEPRFSQGVETPLTAQIVAIESVDNGLSSGSTIFIACDVIQISTVFQDAIAHKVAFKDASIDTAKLVVSATHTHNAPALWTHPHTIWYNRNTIWYNRHGKSRLRQKKSRKNMNKSCVTLNLRKTNEISGGVSDQ